VTHEDTIYDSLDVLDWQLELATLALLFNNGGRFAGT
jgi:uncharacterized protein with ParB-like and HNH nuclease domain